MFRFTLNIAGEVQMDQAIARFSEGCADYRPIWGMIEDDFYAQEADQFKTEGAEGGEHWKELSPEYAKWKAMEYPGKPILERTGDLKRSLTKGSDPNAVKIEERRRLTLGSRIPYGIYHQSIEPRRKLPRRPEIMLTADFKKTVMRHLHGYMVQMATQIGMRKGLAPIEAAKLGSIYGRGIPPMGTSPRRSVLGGWNF